MCTCVADCGRRRGDGRDTPGTYRVVRRALGRSEQDREGRPGGRCPREWGEGPQLPAGGVRPLPHLPTPTSPSTLRSQSSREQREGVVCSPGCSPDSSPALSARCFQAADAAVLPPGGQEGFCGGRSRGPEPPSPSLGSWVLRRWERDTMDLEAETETSTYTAPFLFLSWALGSRRFCSLSQSSHGSLAVPGPLL